MKRVMRNTFILILLSPLIVAIYVTSIFVGREKCLRLWSPRVTNVAKQVVKLFVPSIASADRFDQLPSKMKSRFWFWKLFYDIEVTEDTGDVFQLKLRNCPFCETFTFVGLSKLNPYACEGDWAYARENTDKWTFERKHQIGTGDRFCDHTYKRLKR